MKSKLKEHFLIEASPFDNQAAPPNPMGSATMATTQKPNTSMSHQLDAVEDMLRKILVANGESSPLSKIINKFLVDITPYMEG